MPKQVAQNLRVCAKKRKSIYQSSSIKPRQNVNKKNEDNSHEGIKSKSHIYTKISMTNSDLKQNIESSSFSLIGHLKTHIETFYRGKKFKCDICLYGFTLPRLNIHPLTT